MVRRRRSSRAEHQHQHRPAVVPAPCAARANVSESASVADEFDGGVGGPHGRRRRDHRALSTSTGPQSCRHHARRGRM